MIAPLLIVLALVIALIVFLLKTRHDKRKQSVSSSLSSPNTSKPESSNTKSKAQEIMDCISKDTHAHFAQLEPLLIDCVAVSFAKGECLSMSEVQRRYTIGYPRASYILDTIEKLGLVSPLDPNRKRTLLVSLEDLPLALDSIDISHLLTEKRKQPSNTSTGNTHINLAKFPQENNDMPHNISDIGHGIVKVSQKYLMQRYLKNAILPEDIFWDCIDGDGYIMLPKQRLDEMENKRIDRIEKDNKLFKCVSLNNKGIAFEKEGKILQAIKVYEQNIAGESPYPATHSFDRLMVLYRKQKDYHNEIRVIQIAIQTFPSMSKYKDRLTKAQLLLAKV